MKHTASVVIVGAGPVGMTLAIDLGRRGVSVIVVERRPSGEPPPAKCNHVSSRSMETYRRLGLADAIRKAGLPDDHSTDVVYAMGVKDELVRFGYPSRAERFGPERYPDSHWPTPEPMHRVNQMWFEPVLHAALLREPTVTLLSETELLRFEDRQGSVVAWARAAGGAEIELEAEYLVACDGGRSSIRRALGISLAGDDDILHNQSTLFRADIHRHLGPRPAWMYWFLHREWSGTLIAIDGKGLWLHHTARRKADPSDEERKASIRTMLGIGDLAIEIVHREQWTGRRLIAERFRSGRVFLCGDAAHVWVPFAGYGMNAGIASAEDLAWQLAAVVGPTRWGGPKLLDAYNAERAPISEQVSRHVTGLAADTLRASAKRKVPLLFFWGGPVGRLARRVLRRIIRTTRAAEFAPEGLNFGYHYDGSPIIAYDGDKAPDYSLGSHQPSTVPGCRVPHFWFEKGVSLYDRMGANYTLLRFDSAIDVAPLVDAAKQRSVPLEVLDVPSRAQTAEVRAIYGAHRLVLGRPDRHVAWRGTKAPLDALALIDRIRGAR